MKQGKSISAAPTGGGTDRTEYDLVMTHDGSFTLYSREYDEHMHSLSGAYEEALLKHVLPSGILERGSDRLAVLDVGFGLGYNILALIDSLSRKNFNGSLSVISLEKDRSLLPYIRRISFPDIRDEAYSFIRGAYMNETVQNSTVRITVMFGDARISARSLPDGSFDAVFFDPFSPSRNPELWSVDFLREMFRLMDSAAVLTTYSSAQQIRGALLDAGFFIGRGPSVGGKREGTLAAKTGVITSLPSSELAALRDDCRSVPYRDESLSGAAQSIVERRRKEMGIMREKQKFEPID
jgi:tRNA U34 5-methylaminomethyl-2-thiouridine-forming methyltransferase MnmC